MSNKIYGHSAEYFQGLSEIFLDDVSDILECTRKDLYIFEKESFEYNFIYDERTSLGESVIIDSIPYYIFEINGCPLMDLGNGYMFRKSDKDFIFQDFELRHPDYLQESAGRQPLSSSRFASLYNDILNSINKYSWITVPPKILWNTLEVYTDAFIKLNKIMKVSDIYIGNDYDRLSDSEKLKAERILKSIKKASFFTKRKDNLRNGKEIS